MLKKVLLFFLLVMISNFSHTPHLQVLDPSTWLNESVWDVQANLWSILKPGSDFYTAYSYGFNAEFIFRKIAHFTFFGLLALLFYWNLRKQRGRYIKAWLLLVFFALLDEVHQAFIIGRDGRVVDVMIDSFGGGFFLFLLYVSKKRSAA